MQVSAKVAAADATPASAPAVSSRLARAVGTLAAWIIRAEHWSWRKDVGEGERIDELLSEGKRLLAIFWHGKYLPLFPLLAGRRACIFTTPCFRGEVIAEISRRFGYECCFIPSVGGRPARAAMYEALGSGNAAAFAVDGPLGPYHRVKRGALDISADIGFTLLPVSASARQRHVVARRWDRSEIPWPFARVALTVGEPIDLSGPPGRRNIPKLKQHLHDALEELGRRADRKVGLREEVSSCPTSGVPAATLHKSEEQRP